MRILLKRYKNVFFYCGSLNLCYNGLNAVW